MAKRTLDGWLRQTVRGESADLPHEPVTSPLEAPVSAMACGPTKGADSLLSSAAHAACLGKDALLPSSPRARQEEDALLPSSPRSRQEEDALLPSSPRTRHGEHVLLPSSPRARQEKDVLLPCSPRTRHGEHVLLPCSPRARCVDGAPLWAALCALLSPPPASPPQLLAALEAVRDALGGEWTFDGLQELLTVELHDDERQAFFRTTVPAICSLALRLPALFPTPLPLLRAGRQRSVCLTAEQCGCLLAHAFLCSFPGRNGEGAGGLPYFSLCHLHGALHPPRRAAGALSAMQLEKWRCLLAYFSVTAHRLAADDPTVAAPLGRKVHFTRQVADTSDLEWSSFWLDAQHPLARADARPDGTIEDSGSGVLQVDFANKTIGGGVLRNGCVQEEIRFLLCPELIVSRLLAEPLLDNEALLMRGFERYCRYTGYASSFAYAGPYDDEAVLRGEQMFLLAIDATNFSRQQRLLQFEDAALEREVNKAYVGFAASDSPEGAPICTGNWGCGVFGGDAQLKALLQLMAASAASRACVQYLTFGDRAFAARLQALVARLRSLDCRVGMLAALLHRFDPYGWPPSASTPQGGAADLFGYLEEQCDGYEAEREGVAEERETHGEGEGGGGGGEQEGVQGAGREGEMQEGDEEETEEKEALVDEEGTQEKLSPARTIDDMHA
ncbi:hypothetical protein AB1Y20_001873 [Prymnesium parvum]|uniref:poly(ADP-ribose) glycohydrolase n=1 Tax=Prymnesium parvum TaxID=97485 RepID=A0AB34J7A3_PRYPA